MKRKLVVAFATFVLFSSASFGQEESNWKYDVGVSLFKTSLNSQPDELLYNPVFTRWEKINQNTDQYTIGDYKRLDPYPFNLSAGFDCLFKYKKYFMIKLGYNYTNTLGIGGKGNISYLERTTNLNYSENKEMSYSSHQINYFVGPCIPISENGPEIFMGFSMMSPTWVVYNEKYSKIENGIKTVDYNKKFTGFFGNCRSMIGMQVPLTDKLRIGTDIIFSFFNGLELKNGSLKEQGFKFPLMQWHFTLRYKIK